jgi:hypothetical protein
MEKNMRVRLIALTIGAVASSLVAFSAQACGESLFRVGRGAVYRAQTAPLPGNVLLVAPSAEARALAERLAAAGHRVSVVETADLIGDELQKNKYDVVLASYNDRELVAAQTTGATAAPAYVPVATEEGQRALAAQSYDRYLSRDDDFTQFLRVIHRTLKASQPS